MKNSAKNTLLFFFCCLSIAGGIVAWQQYRELASLRDTGGDASDQSDLRRQLAAAQQRLRELQDELASRRSASQIAADEPPGPARGPADADSNPGGRRGGPGDPRAFFENPQAQKLMQQQQKLALDGRFAPLFKTLNLSTASLDQFKSLLLEKQTVMPDVMAAAREQGVDPRDNPQEFRKMVAAAQADVDGSIKSLLGDEGFANYQQYQQTLPQRSVVNQLQQSLSYTNAPLSAAQADQLVQILASTAPQPTAGAGGMPPEMGGRGGFGGGPGGGMGGGPGGGPVTAPITTEAVALAQQVLSTPQLEALQQLQQTQQAQEQLNQMRRGGARRGGG